MGLAAQVSHRDHRGVRPRSHPAVQAILIFGSDKFGKAPRKESALNWSWNNVQVVDKYSDDRLGWFEWTVMLVVSGFVALMAVVVTS